MATAMPSSNAVLLPEPPAPSNKDVAPSAPVPQMSFKTPKNTLLTIVKAGMAKGDMKWYNIAIMSFIAGAFIGFGAEFMLQVAGGMNAGPGSIGALSPGLVKLLSGATFSCGLMYIVLTGGELFTGNVMFMSAAYYAGKTTLPKVAKSLLLSYFFNFAGAVTIAYFLTYLSNVFDKDPWRSYLTSMTVAKCHLPWGVAFLKGVGANWLVCVAVYLGITSDSFEGKIFGIWWPITTFVAIGFEHSIANMYIVTLGLMYNAKTTFGEFLAWNLIPCTLGNILAGSVFVAGAYYFVYHEHAAGALKVMRLHQGWHRAVHKRKRASNSHLTAAALNNAATLNSNHQTTHHNPAYEQPAPTVSETIKEIEIRV